MEDTDHHYILAHLALPSAFFEYPFETISLLRDKPDKDLLADLWKDVCALSDDTPKFDISEVDFNSIYINDLDTVVVTLPKPENITEAFYVAMLYKINNGKEFIRLFTLEKTKGSQGLVSAFCERLKDGTHILISFEKKLSLPQFLLKIESKL